MVEQDLVVETDHDPNESKIRMQVAKIVAGVLTKPPDHQIQSIILIGSTARGDARRNSDIDMCVFSKEVIYHYSVMRAVAEYLAPEDFGGLPGRSHSLTLHFQAFGRSDVQASASRNRLLHVIEREGIILFPQKAC